MNQHPIMIPKHVTHSKPLAKICYITTCMGRLDMLRQTLGTMVGQPRSSCVAVDYSCPDGAGNWVQENYPMVHVVRIPGQTKFQGSRARNAGAAAAPRDADWFCLLDADIRLASSFATEVIPSLQPGHYYRPQPIPNGAAGTFLVSKSDFLRVGGYDEVYIGYGGADIDLYANLKLLGLTPKAFPGHLLEHLPHLDTERTRFYDEKNLWATVLVHDVYLRIKFDLMKRTNLPLPLASRQAIYDAIRPKVLAWRAAGATGPLVIRVSLGVGRSASQDLVYRFAP